MAYEVTITASDGQAKSYPCAGASDQDALIYGGKIVESVAGETDHDASVSITKNGMNIGPAVTVAEIIQKSV